MITHIRSVIILILLFILCSCAPSIFVYKTETRFLVNVNKSKHLVIFPILGMTVQEKKGDGICGYMIAGNDDGFIFSIRIEPVGKYSTAVDYRMFVIDNVKQIGEYSDLKTWEEGDIAFSEYFIKTSQNVQINQKHVNMFVSKDGYLYNLHLSKMFYETQNDKTINYFFNNVEFKIVG